MEGGEGGDSREHAVVYGTGVVQERPNNLLEGLSFSGGCGGGSIGGGDLGGGVTVYDPFVYEGGAGVADAVGADGLQKFGYIVGEGEGDGAGGTVVRCSVP